MAERVAWVSSMQLGREMDITHRMTVAADKVLREADVTSRIFFDVRGDGVPGDEFRYLKRQADAAMAWGPTALLSIHDDWVADVRRTGILMCVAQGRAVWAKRLGQLIAAETGYPFDSVRNTYGGYIVISRPEKLGVPAAIIEVGDMGTITELAELERRAEEVGRGIGRAWLTFSGVKPAPTTKGWLMALTDKEQAEALQLIRENKVSTVRTSGRLKWLVAHALGQTSAQLEAIDRASLLETAQVKHKLGLALTAADKKLLGL